MSDSSKKPKDDGGSVLQVPYSNGIKPVVMVGAWPHDVRILKTPEELAEWERRMEAYTGVKHDAKAFMAGGGSCCGGDQDGQCDFMP